MIDSVEFQDFKALRRATLPLGRFTLIVGPNGSGKTTALQALQAVAGPLAFDGHQFSRMVSAGSQARLMEVAVHWIVGHDGLVVFDSDVITKTRWQAGSVKQWHEARDGRKLQESDPSVQDTLSKLRRIRLYSFDAAVLSLSATVEPTMELQPNGRNIAAVLDELHGRNPERFEALNNELSRWLPEFDRVLLEAVASGQKALALRTRHKRHRIPAQELSQGTLIALAILTLAYLPDPPSVLCLEEPDRGMHPRLLRRVRDALYRLSHPVNFGDDRHPVQVIATTHSPYLLDLYRDHPAEVVISQRIGQDASFQLLSERTDIEEILGDTQLGEAWYSGILGGVPTEE